LNNINENIQYHHEDILNWNSFNYDFILAKINRHITEDLITKFQYGNGTILLSGILETDYNYIYKLCRKHQLQVKEKMIKGEWICINIPAI